MSHVRRASTALASTGALITAALLITTAAAQRQAPAQGDWRRGETLYRQNCASCHGGDLKGRMMAPSLLGVSKRMNDHEIMEHARKIGESMCCARHILKLTDPQFADINAYFRAVDTDSAIRRRAAQTGGGGMSCCSMMGGMNDMSGMHAPSDAERLPQTVKAGGLSVTLETMDNGPQAGSNTFRVRVHDETGPVLRDARVRLSLSMPTMSMAGPSVAMKHERDGTYTAKTSLSMMGAWRAEVSFSRPGEQAVTANFDFHTQATSGNAAPSRRESPKPRRRGGCCG